MVEKQTGKRIKILRSNKGGEYISGAFIKYCKQNGIMQQFTIPHTPQQNGVAERKNRTLVECARSMVKSKGLSNSFGAEAINTTVYLKNRSPTKYLEHKTPFEAFYGFKPKVSHLRIFGCKAFAHIPKEDRRKLDAKAIKCIFIGYCTDQKAYKMYDPSSHKVFASRDVIFHEHVDKQIKEDEHNIWPYPYENFKEEEEVVESTQVQEHMDIPKDTSRNQSPKRSD